MKPFISETAYNVINYIGSIVVLSLYYTADLRHVGGAATFIPILMGSFLFYISTFNKKLGIVKQFPIQMSLFLAMFAGFFLMVSPLLFGFGPEKDVFWPHLLFGAFFFLCAIFTKGTPFLSAPHDELPEAGITSTDASEGKLMV